VKSLTRISVAGLSFALLCIGMALQFVPLPNGFVSATSPNTHEWRQDLLIDVNIDSIGRQIVEHDLGVSLNGRSHNITVDIDSLESRDLGYTHSTISITPDSSILASWRFIGWVAAALASFAIFRRKAGMWLVTGIFALGLVEASYGLMHIGGGSSFGLQEKVHFIGAATGSFVSKNHFSALVYLSLGAALTLLLTGRRRRLVMAGSVLLMAALLLSMSRGGIFAAAVATLIFWPSIGRGQIFSPATIRSGGVILVCAAFATGIVARFYKLFEGDTSLDGRINIWGDSIELWRQAPVFGSGMGSFDDAAASVGDIPMVFRFAHAHSEPLQLLAEGGIVLFIPALVLVFWFNRLLFSKRRTDCSPVFVGFAFGIVCLQLQALVDFPFRNEVVSLVSAVVFGGLISQCAVVLTMRSKVLVGSSYLFLILITTSATVKSTPRNEIDRDESSYISMLAGLESTDISNPSLGTDLEGVISDLKRELPRNPIAPELHSHLAHSYALLARLARGSISPRTEKSAEWYEANAEMHIGHMIGLQGRNPRVFMRAAHIQSILETGSPVWRSHRDHRLSSFERAIELDPWLASYAFAALSDIDAREIEQMHIQSPRGDYERGRALLALGAVDSAYESFTRAVVGLESWAPAWFMLGETCRRMGDTDCANEAYMNSLAHDQRNEVMKGWAQYWIGDELSAIDTFSRFLESNPGHEWAEQGLILSQQATAQNRQ
jgi:tetratricopeptide (TPR) repeat protein